jgi:hypothetical protein
MGESLPCLSRVASSRRDRCRGGILAPTDRCAIRRVGVPPKTPRLAGLGGAPALACLLITC